MDTLRQQAGSYKGCNQCHLRREFGCSGVSLHYRPGGVIPYHDGSIWLFEVGMKFSELLQAVRSTPQSVVVPAVWGAGPCRLWRFGGGTGL